MLRASSQGLSLPLVVIPIPRIKKLHVWYPNTPLAPGYHLRPTKRKTWKNRKPNVQAALRVDEQENVERMTPSTAHFALFNQDPAFINITRNRTSCPLHKPAIKKMFWTEIPPIQEHPSLAPSGVVDGSSSLQTKIEGALSPRDRMLSILATATSPPEAWEAYTTLRHMIPDDYDTTVIPYSLLHRLCRLLLRSWSMSHMQFLRLFSVLNYIRSTGGRIHLHEWNSLINHAARGWRRTLQDDWEIALSLYNDMVHGRTPGAELYGQPQLVDNDHAVEPDIYTFNILLNIAAKTGQSSTVRRVLGLMTEAGINPNRISFLTLLRYYGLSRQMPGVRSTILRMRDQGHELGLDGVHACMWAYGLNGHCDLVKSIYGLLRHNLWPETDDTRLALARRIEDEEYLCVAGDIEPDVATFTMVIQIMAYHGDLSAAEAVFTDMLASPAYNGQTLSENTNLLDGAFRALFLGFFKHGIPPTQNGLLSPRLRISNRPSQLQWSLQNLQKIFETFMSLADPKASRSTLHWIMSAFDVTSGQDKDILREVWKKLDNRFGMCRFGSMSRLTAWRKRLFDGDESDSDLS